jgi:hypothetical protein
MLAGKSHCRYCRYCRSLNEVQMDLLDGTHEWLRPRFVPDLHQHEMLLVPNVKQTTEINGFQCDPDDKRTLRG